MIARPRPVLPRPACMLVTDSTRRHDREAIGETWLDDVVRDAVLGGINIVQLREKQMPLGDLIALGLHVRDAIAGRALFFVNGDIDAVIALDADGIHLPELGPPVDAVRDRLGDRILVSRAVHSPEAAARAERDGTDFVQAGTVFPSTSHPGTPTIGLEGLRAICAAVTLPVVAIGAITPDNARDALETGAAGVAVIGAVFDADDPRHAASELRASLGVGAARR